MRPWFSVKVVPGRIGGSGSIRKLKPAVFDPDSVDVDLDGMHQEGTTAQWFGLGRDNPIFKAVEAAFKGQKDHGLTDAVRERNFQLAEMRNAPPVEMSTLEFDTAFISGVVEDLVDGDPKKVSGAVGEAAAQFLAVREEQRSKLGVSKVPKGVPDADKGDSLSDKIRNAIAGRKKRRLEKQSELTEKARKLVSDKERGLADRYRRHMAGEGNSESWDSLWHRVRKDYEKRFPAPDLNDYANSEIVKRWERDNPHPQRNHFDSNEEFAWAIDEWEDDRTAAMFDAASFDRKKWEDDFNKEVEKAWIESNEDDAGVSQDPFAMLQELFTFDFEGSDGKTYSAVVDRAEDVFGSQNIIGTIYNDQGEDIGLFERSFNSDTGDVHHDHLKFHAEKDRKLGLGSVFNARNEELYREMGFSTVSVGGMSSASSGYVGATHWPKTGFDWADDFEKEKTLKVIRRALDQYDKRVAKDPNLIPVVFVDVRATGTRKESPIFSSKDQRDQIAELLKRAESEALDTVDRLTASDVLDWSGAEISFQVAGVMVGYVKPL